MGSLKHAERWLTFSSPERPQQGTRRPVLWNPYEVWEISLPNPECFAYLRPRQKNLPFWPSALEGFRRIKHISLRKKCPTTERTYLKDLEVITSWFQSSVSKDDCMPETLKNLIFSNFEPLHKFHTTFLKEIEQRLALW
ncbi:UNVERIFIED_CONTAM: hypothetical protein K2H54_034139 [Gekko kuhli]